VNHSYHFKAFRYPVDQKNLNVDFDLRFLVMNYGFRYPCNLQRPFGDASRIIFRTPRIIFEDEANKARVTYFRAYEKAVEDSTTERELWFEINTVGAAVSEAHLNVQVNGGEVTDIELVQKDYEPYVEKDGYDPLTINSADWANKTTNLNISSRAAAPYSTASGNDSRAEGEAGDVGGINNVGKGKASIVRGESITERGLYNAVFGNKHEFLGTDQNAQSNLVGGGANKIKEKASYNLVAGNGNTVGGSSNVVGGGGGSSEVTGGYDLAVGYSQKVTGEGSANVGHYNKIAHKQAQTFGRYLATGRNYQARFGVGAERDSDGTGKDKSSMLVVSNGAEGGGTGVDIFAVSNAYSGDATSGYYAKASQLNHGITLGFFNNTLKQEIIDAVIDALPTAEGSEF
jgi:hypothetical protein